MSAFRDRKVNKSNSQQMMSSDEVDTDNRALDCSKKKSPLKTVVVEDKLHTVHRLVTPAGYELAIRTS